MGYQVTAPLVVAKKQDGTYVHIYEGGTLPEDIDEDQLEQLLKSKMVAEADGDDTPKRPTKRAGVDKWREYALATGHTEEDIDGLSKDELVALVGE